MLSYFPNGLHLWIAIKTFIPRIDSARWPPDRVLIIKNISLIRSLLIRFPLPVMPYANESFSFESYFGIIKLYACVLHETIPKAFFQILRLLTWFLFSCHYHTQIIILENLFLYRKIQVFAWYELLGKYLKKRTIPLCIYCKGRSIQICIERVNRLT